MSGPNTAQRSPTRSPGPSRPSAGKGASVHVVGAGVVVFTPGVKHDHKPCGRWADIQARPCSERLESVICSELSPENVVRAAIVGKFLDKPIALAHLNWFLDGGAGANFVEDANIESLLRQDDKIREQLRRAILGKSGRIVRHRRIEQRDYADSMDGQDFRFAFGAIDRFDWIADFTAGTFKAWFQDCYEWHPFYPGLYSVKPGDGLRSASNCVHAACVELKAGTARDFWMKGQATIDLGVILAPPKSSFFSWP